MTVRFFVLAEPYGPLDFTICRTAGDAVRATANYREQGLNTVLVETTGTITDVRPILRKHRDEYVTRLATELAS